jgi:nucleoside-diphosphate-sugar epimerase
MKTVLVTGAGGFIGQAVCIRLMNRYRIIALSRSQTLSLSGDCTIIDCDIEDGAQVSRICSQYMPDTVIHCAGLAHQKSSVRNRENLYESINSIATYEFAKAALSFNPDVYFIFLSSISVYGESFDGKSVCESDECFPTSDYGKSKLSAEKRLRSLYDAGYLKKLDILRLAPVYDSQWTFNLDKRVMAPGKKFFLRFGSGEQRMSALARNNLVDFIDFRLRRIRDNTFFNVFNICDKYPYSFNEIIENFKKSDYYSCEFTVHIPLCFIKIPITLAATVLKRKSVWIYSFYDKISKDLVFDTGRMAATGFIPEHDLESVLAQRS